MTINNSKIWGGMGLMVLGFLLCLTIIGAVVGIPLVIVGVFIACSGVEF